MKNFKKIALGLAVMLIAFGFSAFKHDSRKSYDYIYYGIADNLAGTEFHWQSNIPDSELDCDDVTVGACVISTQSPIAPNNDAMPSEPYIIESGSNKLYR